MKQLKLRSLAFHLHRYIGLVVGLLLVFVGLTGSLLVFEDEIDHFLLNHQMGYVIPQGQQISFPQVLDTVKAAYSNYSELKVDFIRKLPKPDVPYQVILSFPEGESTEVIVNPYTGAIMGSRIHDNTLTSLALKLHYQLLAGKTGQQILGVVGLLLFFLSITGIILWPGWLRLIAGFKMKFTAHPKRVNFDIHKVIGIIAAAFLAITGFTGFCFNYYEFSQPIIYALTFTPNLPNPVSKPIAGKAPLSLSQLLQKADMALPNAVTTYVLPPKKPEDAFGTIKKLPQESWKYGLSQVYLDQYTGEVVRLKNALEAPLGEKILDSFIPLHFGTFGGLPSRVLYVFIGFTPWILFLSGIVMYRYRYWKKLSSPNRVTELSKRL
ncbi:PepSY domain-containing protein [Scytonema sp. UIC 10036]|uniref:PepSY-associated TM helix domain-containing protein n=1 Tax=Scytonema sp. UIC 10036 TaxID=2304196 RepID=UPI0012DA2F75|nr:PepSY-associated TM helix domain-containing protein [Scytonema sp. UIC 10036]MUG96468.1 PepSY domain-containing protein [Scytonema sp. UIC 10036]